MAGSGRSAAPVLATAALVLLAVLLLGAAPAQGAPTKIAGWGQGAGKVDGPNGVAVDNSCALHEPPLDETTTPTCAEYDPNDRDLYVADQNNFRIDRFGPEGDFQLAWGFGVADGKSAELQVCPPAVGAKRCFGSSPASGPGAVFPEAVAVDPSSHDVYVADPSNYRVSKFTPGGALLYMLGRHVNKTKAKEEGPGAPYGEAEKDICTAADLAAGEVCGAGESGTGAGEFAAPASLAVEPSGDVWVGDLNRVERFHGDGAFVSEAPVPGGAGYGEAFPGRVIALAPAPGGNLYTLRSPFSERQQISTTATSGTYTLTFKGTAAAPLSPGQTTKPIACNAGNGTISSALEELPAIGQGNLNVLVTGQRTVTFWSALSAQDIEQMSASGCSPSATVTTVQEGAPGGIDERDASSGSLLRTLYTGAPRAFAADSDGNLYLGTCGVDGTRICPSAYRLLKLDPSGAPVSVFAAGQVLGAPEGAAIALDEAHDSLYTASGRTFNPTGSPASEAELVAVQRFALPAPGPLPSEARAEDVLPTTATLAATLNPEGHKTRYRFQYLTLADYEAQGESFEGPHTEETPLRVLPGAEYEEEAVSAAIEGLVPGTAYRFRLLAEDEEDAQCPEAAEECTAFGEEATFATRTAVGIEAEWASELSAHDATLNARLDPLGVKAGWWLEYDTSPYEGEARHGVSLPIPEGSLPASFGELPVAVAVGGLQPATTYHYRFVATDERATCPAGKCATYGPDQSFTTQPGALGFALPDGRAWEMVSPPDKHGGRVSGFDGSQGGQVQAAENGEALAYLSVGSLEANPEGNRLIEQSSELAKRGSGGAWRTIDITPPHTKVNIFEAGGGLEYKLFSANLQRALLDPRDCTPLSPAASERTPYVRDNAAPPTYEPLVTAELVPGAEFGGDCNKPLGSVVVNGASPDLRHVVLGSTVALREGDAAGGLYERSEGELLPVSVLPEGGGGGAVQARLGSGATLIRGAVSEDGSRVFWSAGGLYMRDTARGQTLRLDEEQEGAFGTGHVAPIFQGASADGSTAFFTDTQNLTPDANEEGSDLYRWTAPGSRGCGQVGGCLEDLSAGVVNLGESAEVLGLLPGLGEDGDTAYFVARGTLATNVVDNGAGPQEARAGEPNLYAWGEAGGVRFVATLSGEDEHDWGSLRSELREYQLTAASSPSGRYLAFMSSRPLTGYDNRALGGGESAQEVFLYDAQSERLTCASCEPTGARPRVWRAGSERPREEGPLDPEQIWGGVGGVGEGWTHTVAALVPERARIGVGGPSIYTPRYVQDDGRVFFNAVGPLAPADSNGASDVYEFEPVGVGSCSASSGDPGTAVVPGGCVSLISSGTAEGTSTFLDASEGAGDVFFYSPARLSVSDQDGELDVYDAREDGEPATLKPAAECLGEACQPPATAPESQTPASASFRGPGNVHEASKGRRCPKGKRKVRRKGKARCVTRGDRHRGRHPHRRKHQSHRNGRVHR